MEDGFGVEFKGTKWGMKIRQYVQNEEGDPSPVLRTIDAGGTRELSLLTLLLNARSVPGAISGELQSQRMRPRSA